LKILIIGLGYVGLPLALAFAAAGHDVWGLDTDKRRVKALEQNDAHTFNLASSIDACCDAEAYFICVPTPNTPDGEPDMTALLASARDIAPMLKLGNLVACESTTYPGAVESVLIPELEARSGLRAGHDFLVAYSPERIDPGPAGHSLRGLSKLVAGHTPAAFEAARRLYEDVCPVVPVANIRTAEAAKQIENIFRLVNISLVNELKPALEALDVDVWEALEAAATKPFGFMAFEPGPGVGGHCIAVDPAQLIWAAEKRGADTPLVRLALALATDEPRRVVDRLEAALVDQGDGVGGKAILVVGAAYKRDVADTRQSPAIAIMSELVRRNAVVSYTDPLAPVIRLSSGAILEATPVAEVQADQYVGVVIATDHSIIDWPALLNGAALVIDTRNVTRGLVQAVGQRFVRV